MKKKKPDKTQQEITPPPPPAPMRGPSRQALLKILRRPDAEDHLPITLAKYRPDAVVRKEGDVWVIRALVEDREAVHKASEEAMARGDNFMDEHTWRFLHPGKILIEAATREDFIKKIKGMDWYYGEEDGREERPHLKHK
jgi:hypothetical protein